MALSLFQDESMDITVIPNTETPGPVTEPLEERDDVDMALKIVSARCQLRTDRPQARQAMPIFFRNFHIILSCSNTIGYNESCNKSLSVLFFLQ